MKKSNGVKASIKEKVRSLGPITDLESHLPQNWWLSLFNSLYLKTDGDVVENHQNTVDDIDMVIELAGLKEDMRILDLCCGQGRHSLELARRNFQNITGIDRSRYLVRLAKKRAQQENLTVSFHEGDARHIKCSQDRLDAVLLMGNSFGYFERQEDDVNVLRSIAGALGPEGIVLFDLVDGEWMRDHYEPRTWEWIDEKHFVCRERQLTGDRQRIISREVITHSDKGVIVDQFYAERLYTQESLTHLLKQLGFRSIQYHQIVETQSLRGQDLGMMGRRMILTALAPIKAPAVVKTQKTQVLVLMGDPSLPDKVKVNGQFNQEDMETIAKMKKALGELGEYRFRYHCDHKILMDALRGLKTDLVLNLCDEGYMNDAFMELHVTALMDMLKVPYTGAGPACLGLCYNKSLVKAIAESLDIPVPLESYLGASDNAATIPSVFPALIKPNFGDSSIGITKNAVVNNANDLLDYVDTLRKEFEQLPILIQEFLPGTEYSVGIIGNPGYTYRILPILEVDYSKLDPDLPQILGYESKWLPNSPYWNSIQYRPAQLDEETTRVLCDYSNRLFGRLGCQDYARFDFRANDEGRIKLLEVNPNPGWCWDGKMAIMAGWADLSYADMLGLILQAAKERLSSGCGC